MTTTTASAVSATTMTLRRRLDSGGSRRRPRAVLECGGRPGCRLQRRRDAEEESCQERCTESVEEHDRIDVDSVATGQARFQRGRQQVHAPESDEDADSGSACREHEALDGQLTRDPGASGSERYTN